MLTAPGGTSEISILNRILRSNAPTFSVHGARDILGLDFDQADKDRMRELSAKARAGTLTADEDAEAGHYELIGHLLHIMQSKARRSLRDQRTPMSSIKEITAAIEQLPADQLAVIQAWIAEYAERQWDEQIARDEGSGKLDTLIDRALGEHQAGRTKLL